MTTRVYQFGLLPPTGDDARLVREQLRAAHEYRNDLVAVERGRRWAIRRLDDTPEVREAIEVVKASTRSNRREAIKKLSAARKVAREAAADEIALIDEREASILRDARALTKTYWGTYLIIERAHQQSRGQPLYGDNGYSPNDPAFVRGPRWREAFEASDPRAVWYLAPGSIGMQIQKTRPLTTADVLACKDSRVQLKLGHPNHRGRRFGELRIRVGSQGRAPIFATFPIKTHREIPDNATWSWVRVSLRVEGPREKWTVEITVDDDSPRARDFAVLDGAVALELEWSVKPSDEIQVASWEDTLGERGVIILPARLVKGLQKPSGIRAVRDIILNDFRTVLAKEIRTNARHAPQWLVEAASVMHLWKSPTRFIALAHRMRKKSAEPRKVYEMLDAWESRERHLYEYESGARGEAIRERREFYRVLAAQWGKKYKHVLLSDQDLSREARWGEDSDLRFLASPAELRNCLRNVFGKDAIDARWRRTESEKETCESWVSWCLEQWRGGSETVFTSPTERTKNAWAARKAKKKLPGKIGEWSTG